MTYQGDGFVSAEPVLELAAEAFREISDTRCSPAEGQSEKRSRKLEETDVKFPSQGFVRED
jgi:hypothetical protein